MFEIKLLIKSIDADVQKMRYSLNKFNLQNSVEFRAKICKKLKLSGVFEGFKLRKLVIDRIEEGIAFRNEEETSSSHPVVVIKIFGNLVQNRVAFDPFYQLVKKSWTDVSAIEDLSKNMITKLNGENVVSEDRGIYPSLSFIQAIDIYDSWKSGNTDVSDIINKDSAVSCGENIDVFFIVERQTNFAYQNVNSFIKDLITYRVISFKGQFQGKKSCFWVKTGQFGSFWDKKSLFFLGKKRNFKAFSAVCATFLQNHPLFSVGQNLDSE